MDLGESFVEPWGLAGDRRWLLVDRKGRFVSEREKPSLARVVVQPCGGGISVSADGLPGPAIAAPPAGGAADGDRLALHPAGRRGGPRGRRLFSAFLGHPVRLVYLDDPTRRPVDPQYGRDGDVVSFRRRLPAAAHQRRLARRTRRLAHRRAPGAGADDPVPAQRGGGRSPARAEDRWRRIRIGAVPFRVAKPCGRCVVTTTDQITGARGKQPLKMLGKRRRFGHELVFGQNLIPTPAASSGSAIPSRSWTPHSPGRLGSSPQPGR